MEKDVANSAGRALGIVISKFISAGDFRFRHLRSFKIRWSGVLSTTGRQCGAAGFFHVFRLFRTGPFVFIWELDAARRMLLSPLIQGRHLLI